MTEFVYMADERQHNLPELPDDSTEGIDPDLVNREREVQDQATPPGDVTTDLPTLDDPQLPTLDDHDLPSLDDIHDQATWSMTMGMNNDAKQTLAGSGGLDPNPDFDPRPANPPRSDQPRPPAPRAPQNPNPPTPHGSTVPHIVPFQHTVVHVPGETRDQPPVQPGDQPGFHAPRTGQHNPPPTQTSAGRVAQSPGYQQQYRPAANVGTQQANPYAPTQPQQPQYPMPPQQGGYGVPGGVPGARPLPPRRRQQRTFLGCSPTCLMVFVGVLVTFCGGLTLVTMVLTATLGAQLENQLQERLAPIETYDNFESTFYYDRNGTVLYEAFTEGRRTNVSYNDFPDVLVEATIAIEDDSFFSNPGFEIPATARAFLQYVNLEGLLGLPEGSTGGSTITQQLVRNVLFDFEYRAERSPQRKIEEILLAVLLTNRMEKWDILEMYLNEIYYGNLAYGAEAASQTFFGKSVRDLTLGEAALLAGLPQAPVNLNPLNPDPQVQANVDARWRLVLQRMVDEGFITAEERDAAIAEGLTYNPSIDVPLEAPHFVFYAQEELATRLEELGFAPEQVARGGLRVYTTLDLPTHEMAQSVAAQQVATLAANNASNAAVLVLQPTTGQIMAMVGSIDYNNIAIDGNVNVTTRPRQPGSTMKPFTYALAMEQGILTPGDILWDVPTNINGYIPRNYRNNFNGPVRIRTALANSLNIPAVQTLRSAGVDNLLYFMQRLGVQTLGTDASQYGVSLTLGGGDMTLLELTRGYGVFANGGTLVPSTAILCVVDNDDNIVYEYEGSCPRGNYTDQTTQREGYGEQVLDPRIAYIISDILGDNAARTQEFGANSPLNTGSLFTSVKTGTTDDFRDNWTVGYTRSVVVGVWVGNNNNDPMINATGVTGAAPIWNQVITGIYSDQAMINQFGVDGQLLPPQPDQPQGVSVQPMCQISAMRDPVIGDCPGRQQELFLDSPAGVPDGAGGFQYPQPEPFDPNPPSSGPWLQEIEPGIYRVLVARLDPNIANSIQFQVAPGEQAPPPPIYCQVPVELAGSTPGAQEQLFLAPPPFGDDAASAEQYARSQGLAFLPTIACSGELATVIGSNPAFPEVVTAYISSPAPGQTVTDNTPIIGTADFGQSQATFYKIEISGGQFGDQWVTLGSTHSERVVNGQLETLNAPGLQPGNYTIQLIVVGNDGNYVQPPFQVPIVVGPPQG